MILITGMDYGIESIKVQNFDKEHWTGLYFALYNANILVSVKVEISNVYL